MFFGEYYSVTFICNIIIILTWFMLADSYKNNNIITKFIKTVGANTFGIYVTHSFVIRIIRLVFNDILFINRILITISVLFLCTTIVFVFKRTPLLKQLFKF